MRSTGEPSASARRTVPTATAARAIGPTASSRFVQSNQYRALVCMHRRFFLCPIEPGTPLTQAYHAGPFNWKSALMREHRRFFHMSGQTKNYQAEVERNHEKKLKREKEEPP